MGTTWIDFSTFGVASASARASTPGGPTAKANNFDPRSTTVSNWGMMDMRWQNKATTAMFDGSVKMQGVEELDDMRKWSNYATSWDWAFQPY